MSKALTILTIAFILVVTGFGITTVWDWLTPTPLTNQQIIEETKYCEENGTDASLRYNGWTGDVTKIICKPKENKS